MAHRLRIVFVFVNGDILSGYGSTYKTAFILPLCQQSLEYYLSGLLGQSLMTSAIESPSYIYTETSYS